jgi:UDP-N-acetylmuramoyl-L-alanyl-D-glutamate--2,6-diaminopimelate ligase
MTFEQILQGAEVLSQSGEASITGVAYDSRLVKPGYLFVAMKGETSDGNQFIDRAIAAGAVAVVSDSAVEKPRTGVAWAQVPHGRRALARLSANFYKKPAERLAITGVTGTNGKSTSAFLLESTLSAAGRKSLLIGTIEYHVAGKILPAPHTTPESLELNQMLAEGVGGFIPRSRAAACVCCPVRCRRLHESHPRPPRLPPHDGRVFRSQANPVRRLRH